jgi:hypothetical protein
MPAKHCRMLEQRACWSHGSTTLGIEWHAGSSTPFTFSATTIETGNQKFASAM